MSGVSTEEKLYCSACKAVTEHATEWSSEEPKEIQAQCMTCFPGRWVSGYTEPRRIGKYNYNLMNRDTQFRKDGK